MFCLNNVEKRRYVSSCLLDVNWSTTPNSLQQGFPTRSPHVGRKAIYAARKVTCFQTYLLNLWYKAKSNTSRYVGSINSLRLLIWSWWRSFIVRILHETYLTLLHAADGPPYDPAGMCAACDGFKLESPSLQYIKTHVCDDVNLFVTFYLSY